MSKKLNKYMYVGCLDGWVELQNMLTESHAFKMWLCPSWVSSLLFKAENLIEICKMCFQCGFVLILTNRTVRVPVFFLPILSGNENHCHSTPIFLCFHFYIYAQTLIRSKFLWSWEKISQSQRKLQLPRSVTKTHLFQAFQRKT